MGHNGRWDENFAGLRIDVGGQTTPQQVFFGTGYAPATWRSVTIPIEAHRRLLFPGDRPAVHRPRPEAGSKAYEGIPNRLAAYSIDIAGSLSGIILFGVAAWFGDPAYPMVRRGRRRHPVQSYGEAGRERRQQR